MQLVKFFVVFVALIGRICLSKMMIEIKKPDRFVELEEAAIQTLTTCYANKDKTIALLGDFSMNFVKRLSAHQSFSLVLFDVNKRAENNIDRFNKTDLNRMHKVNLVVTTASFYTHLMKLFIAYRFTKYFDSMASVLILGWSPRRKDIGCGRLLPTVYILYHYNLHNVLNANLMCRDRKKRLMIYGSNPFTNQAPEPWQFVNSMTVRAHIMFSYFEREYRENEGMCKNLDFEKTHDLNGFPIEVLLVDDKQKNSNKSDETRTEKPKRLLKNIYLPGYVPSMQDLLDSHKKYNFIVTFISYVNASLKATHLEVHVGRMKQTHTQAIISRPSLLKDFTKPLSSYTYPQDVFCSVLITQFRGNKSQLQKILSVIDSYSWVGMYIAYVITLIFFKYFLRQSLIVGILNLFRLTSNLGLTTLPPNVASRIYLSCLLFFVVTMQGIFVGNLASLLTHDVPVRQVNTKQELTDFGYTVRAEEEDLIFFNDSVFNDRVIMQYPDEECIAHVLQDPLIACLSGHVTDITAAVRSNLYVSNDCVIKDYLVNVVPFQWALKERLNKFVGIMTGAETMITFEWLVYEKRLHEAESEEHPLEPKVMTLGNLGFAFAILGIGLGCASISFIVEIMIYRFHRRVKTTRVIVLN